VFYRLGEQGYETRAQIERYYRQRILEKRDKRVWDAWTEGRSGLLSLVRAALVKTARKYQGTGWTANPATGKIILASC